MRRMVGLAWLASAVIFATAAGLKAEAQTKPVAPAFGKAADGNPNRPLRAAIIETTLPTYKDFVPQLAFDGNDATYFYSSRPVVAGDTFTFILTSPAALRKVEVITGKDDATDALDSGVLEASADGNAFVKAGTFQKGICRADLGGKPIKALRLRATAGATHVLAIREIKLAEAGVPTFRYPVQVILDANEVPDLADWGRKAADMVEEWYPVIAERLSGEGYCPPRRIDFNFKKGDKGVAYTAGSTITCFEGWFRSHPEDIGAVFHETVHVVQRYTRRVPGWIVEGVADYMRFWVYEYPPGPRMRLDPARVNYDNSYRVTGAFFDFLTRTYDRDLVHKLNDACRRGQYKADLFKEWTGKDLDKLNDEFRESLKKK